MKRLHQLNIQPSRNRKIRVALGLFLLLSLTSRAQSSRPGWGATVYETETGTGVTFRVWAPNASSVQVGGDFSGWSNLEPFLQPEGTSGVWSADYSGIEEGAAYKFKLNDSTWKSDPRGRWINQAEYGNAQIVKSKSVSNHTASCFIPEAERVIYELHPGTFVDPDPDDDRCGTLWDAIGGLPHLEELGINVIELMPVSEFTSDRSWGYNGAYPFAVEEDYGGPEALKAFVEAAHSRGMMVLLDVVYNHWDASGVLWQFDEWATSPEFGGIYSYASNGICCTPWGPRPDYTRTEVREYIFDNLRMWKEEFGLDGFRWDAPRFILQSEPDNPEDSIYLAEGESLMREAVAMLEDEWPGTVNIAEDLGESDLFDQHWEVGMAERLGEMLAVSNSGVSLSEVVSILESADDRVVYSESHDTAGDLNGGNRMPARVDPDNPESHFARKTSLLAAALVFSMPGTPMILQGQEQFDIRTFSDATPLDWDEPNAEADAVASCYRDLISLRRNRDGCSTGLQGSNINVFWTDDDAQVLAYRRWADDDPSGEVIVVANFSDTTVSNYMLPVSCDGDWMTIFNGDSPAYGNDFSGTGPQGLVARGAGTAVDIGARSCLMFAHATDSDADGLPDWWELERAGDLSRLNGTTDTDADGLTDLQEKAAGTEPLNAASALQCLSGTDALTWSAVAGRAYDIEICEDLTEGFRFWTNRVAEISGPVSLSLTAPGPGNRFYRIRLQ